MEGEIEQNAPVRT